MPQKRKKVRWDGNLQQLGSRRLQSGIDHPGLKFLLFDPEIGPLGALAFAPRRQQPSPQNSRFLPQPERPPCGEPQLEYSVGRALDNCR
jgi:hypothetical protein